MTGRETNEKLFETLQLWDPLSAGPDGYDTEIADVIAAVHKIEHPNTLAKEIQRIYEFSFEGWIPMESCLIISYKLLEIKGSGSCSI